MATPEQLPAEQRVRLQRAHERLRTASQELQSLVATDPVKNRWAPEPAPATILEAAHSELEAAYAALTRCHAQILARAAGTLDVVDKNQALSFSFADLMRHHGPVSPGGVAHAFKVMQRAFPLLEPAGPIERRAVGVATAFGGPGARDGFEAVTRAVTGERYVFDPELAWPERGMALERFVFRLSYRERSVTLVLREGFVSDEFITLARKERTAEEESQLDLLKQEMAGRVMSQPAEGVYDVA